MGKSLLIFKKGFNYSQDGPGNRLVYHLVSCNMHCPWCSNPEGLKKFEFLENEYEEVDVYDVFKEIKKCKRLFFDGGGVTFTGGECMMQYDNLRELIKLLYSEGIDVILETNGTIKKLQYLSPYLKHIIIDFKHYNEEIHKNITGVSNSIIKENIKFYLDFGKTVYVRIPLIKGFNASLDDINGFLEYFIKINCENLYVEFLKYHEYGKDKWNKINEEYRVVDGFVTDEVYNQFINEFKKNDIKIINT